MKKMIGLWLAIMAVMVGVACSEVGTPTSLVGIWYEDDNQGGTRNYIEITSDDYVKYASTKEGLSSVTGTKIIKCTCNEIWLKNDDQPAQVSKYEISGKTLTIITSGASYTYTKD